MNTNLKLSISYFFLVVATIFAFGQKPYVSFEHLTIDDGLSTNTINVFYKDKTGYMWFGSSTGLEKYDGYDIINFTSKASPEGAKYVKDITNIVEDNDNNLWVCNNNGLSSFGLKTEKFTHYFTAKNDSLYGLAVSNLFFDEISNALFFDCGKGLVKFDLDLKKYKIYAHDDLNPHSIPKGGLMGIVKDSKNNIYFTCWANGISKYNRETDDFTNYWYDPKIKNAAFKKSIFGLDVDQDDNIWMVSAEETYIQKFNPFTNTLLSYFPPNGLAFYGNFKIKIDKTNTLWITNGNIGLLRYDSKKNIFSNIKHENENPESLSESRTSGGIYIDYNNNLWVSSLNKGVNKLNLALQTIQNYPVDNKYLKKSSGIEYYLQDSFKNKWVCNEDGVFKLDNVSYQYIKINLPDSENFFHLVDLFDGTILANSKNNTYTIDCKSLKTQKIDLDVEKEKTLIISNSFLDSRKRLWLVAYTNLYLLENGIHSKPVFIHKLSDESRFGGEPYIHVNFLELKDKLIISSEFQFYVLDKATTKVKEIKYGFDISRITSLYRTKDSIYLNCIYGYVTSDFNLKKFNLHQYDFLAEREVVPFCYMYNDSMQCLSTFRGIFIHNLKSNKTIHPKIYNPDKINPDLFFKNKHDNTFSLSAGSGFINFDPKRFEKMVKKPIIGLSSFYLFNKEINIGTEDSPLKESITYSKEITLNHEQNVFSFEITLLNFDEVSKNNYAYKLEGFDKNWNFIGTRKVASFTNLHAGNYVFKYKAKDKNGIFTEEKALKITVLPPFWETWWFRILSIILFSGTIYFIYWYRTRTILKQKVELEHQVRLRTAEISSQNEEILAQRDAIIDHQNVITELYEDIRDSVTTAQRIQESILPSEDLIKLCLPKSFVLYLPKDIVSGDLYWFHVDVDHYYVAAIDCTGHGVAGAFMSLIAHNLLNEIIKEDPNLNPKQILEKLNLHVIQLLHQDSENAISKDGMDVSICKIIPKENKLEFAGANNPLYHIRDGHLEQIKADKNSVGIQPMGKISHFENTIFEFQKGDKFYLFSDGFVGQFGGLDGQEKMKFNRFRQVILDNATLPMPIQKQNILTYLNQFKGKTEQTDDILLMGFEL